MPAWAIPAGLPTENPTTGTPILKVLASGRLAMIHNGIIENYTQLKTELLCKKRI